MLVLLSPAKNLSFDTPVPDIEVSQPAFLKEACALVAAARALSRADLKRLMNISDKLADLNHRRFQAFSTPFTLDNARPAVLTFSGDVYQGLKAATFSRDDLTWAQHHLRILSGLYGLLRPLDLIQPYRLEMGRKLKTDRADDLYGFWGERLTRAVNRAAREADTDIIVNLASKEYFAALQADTLKGRLVTPHFREIRDGKPKFLSFSAKKARGLMARYIITNRLTQADDLKAFDREGYRYSEELSQGDDWVFTRHATA